MPKSFSMDNLAFSIRLPPITALWLEEQAKKVGSFNQAVRNVLDDAQTLYGLPDVMTERLDEEVGLIQFGGHLSKQVKVFHGNGREEAEATAAEVHG